MILVYHTGWPCRILLGFLDTTYRCLSSPLSSRKAVKPEGFKAINSLLLKLISTYLLAGRHAGGYSDDEGRQAGRQAGSQTEPTP
jgi:hypothetical protein